jgi:hypothetical protein
MNWFSVQAERLWHALSLFDVGAIFGNWLFILTLSGLIVGWTIVQARDLTRATRQLAEAFRQAKRRLDRTPPDKMAFPTEFEDVAIDFAQSDLLKSAWRDWHATLIPPTGEDRRPVYATIRPGGYFSLDLLGQCGINPRFHAT